MYEFILSSLRKQPLAYGQGTLNENEDAALLLLETLGLPMMGSVATEEGELDLAIKDHRDRTLSNAERQVVLERLRIRIEERKPTAYIVGAAYQQGIKFLVDEGQVIVPRSFLGEILGSMTKNKDNMVDEDSPPFDVDAVEKVLDLCCGSASLGILAAKILPNVKQVTCVDISQNAIDCASKNVAFHGFTQNSLDSDVTTISLLNGDLYEALGPENVGFDIILCNPPYVRWSAMPKLPAEYRHEPTLALVGGSDGTDLILRVLRKAHLFLRPNGCLVMEIGSTKSALEKRVPDFMRKVGWIDTDLQQDEVFVATLETLRAAFGKTDT